MPTPIRVLVADDHPIVRGGLVALLSTLADVEVVGEASDGAEAVREALLSRPDVVVLDLRMPNVDGVEAARRIGRDLPGTAVLVLTMFDEDDLVADALAAGARLPAQGRGARRDRACSAHGGRRVGGAGPADRRTRAGTGHPPSGRRVVA
ncbi:MAG: response regulator transcription factor [Micropruina glycogenica]